MLLLKKLLPKLLNKASNKLLLEEKFIDARKKNLKLNMNKVFISDLGKYLFIVLMTRKKNLF